jgi:hypothetical protein
MKQHNIYLEKRYMIPAIIAGVWVGINIANWLMQ